MNRLPHDFEVNPIVRQGRVADFEVRPLPPITPAEARRDALHGLWIMPAFLALFAFFWILTP